MMGTKIEISKWNGGQPIVLGHILISDTWTERQLTEMVDDISDLLEMGEWLGVNGGDENIELSGDEVWEIVPVCSQ